MYVDLCVLLTMKGEMKCTEVLNGTTSSPCPKIESHHSSLRL